VNLFNYARRLFGFILVLRPGGSSLFENEDDLSSLCFAAAGDEDDEDSVVGGAAISSRAWARLTSASIVTDAAACRSASSMRANSP
jgi:hypothetical protein